VQGHVAPDDAALLRQVHRGESPALAELIRRHAPYLYGIARSLCGNEHDAEDLVQEVFVATLRAKFRGESSVRTWLVAILVRRAAMLRRSKLRQPLRMDSTPDVTTRAGSPASDAKADMAAMLEALSPEHREVIVLRELQQMSYDQIALVLSIPRGTVESRLHRAREQLRLRFKSYFDV
jgi:RNA polymerase sigma-70 factor (ECF subfamily)